MLNVVKFEEQATRFRKGATRRSPERAVADISGMVSRFRELESKVKTELHGVIFLLDLAVQHARKLVKILNDPALEKLCKDDLLMIEELLQLARDMTRQL
ncbi:MAG: hypothetical protein WB420_08960 [Bradyrhizobium sp.]